MSNDKINNIIKHVAYESEGLSKEKLVELFSTLAGFSILVLRGECGDEFVKGFCISAMNDSAYIEKPDTFGIQ